MSGDLRKVAWSMVQDSMRLRDTCQVRLWAAHDEVTRLRLLLLDAQKEEAIRQRELDRAQEFLTMLYGDLTPSVVNRQPDSDHSRVKP